MGYYKKDNTGIIGGGERIDSPKKSLTKLDKDSLTFPQDGWYWFDTYDQAVLFFANQINTQIGVISIRQARRALDHFELLDIVDNAIINSNNKALQIDWEYATEVRRDWADLITLTTALNISDIQLDEMFAYGATL
jgi:hypothetical protein